MRSNRLEGRLGICQAIKVTEAGVHAACDPGKGGRPAAGECGTIPAMTMLWQPSEEHLRDLPLTRLRAAGGGGDGTLL